MATSAGVLINGVWRQTPITVSNPAIYDQTTDLVAPVTAGTAITLPASGSYTVASGVTSLNIFLNGQKMDYVLDWATSGAGPTYTAIQFLFDLVIGDRIEFRQERNT